MKVCPKCQTPNRDENYYCVECNAVLTGAKKVDDAEVIGEKLKKADKAEKSRKSLLVGIFVFLTVLINGFMVYCAVTADIDGKPFDLTKIWVKFPWYIPIAFLAFFNFDELYCKYRAKKGLPQKHLPDFVNTTIVAFAIIAWFFLECSICGTVLFVK